MNDETPKLTQEEILEWAKGKCVDVKLDTPFLYRYDAQIKSLRLEVPSIPVLGSFLMPVGLDLSSEALKSLNQILSMIAANPDTDIEGRVRTGNEQ